MISAKSVAKIFITTAVVVTTIHCDVFAEDDILQNSLVINRVELLRPLEEKGFSIGAMLSKNYKHQRLSNQELLAIPTYQTVSDSVQKELTLFKEAKTKSGEMFRSSFLKSAGTRFVLVGIVNRMDRGYVTSDRCGETRFIYRLAYSVKEEGNTVSSRLPMTINLVYRGSTDKSNETCASLAQSWLQLSEKSTVEDLLTAGPLQKKFFSYENLDRLEINMQVIRGNAAAAGDFGGYAEYLFKVYKMGSGFQLAETYLENQIDRKKLADDAGLLAELKKWLKQPSSLKSIDEGTVIIPEKFLAKSAYSLAPGGIARSQNRSYYGLVKQADFEGVNLAALENIRSTAGMMRRLNDTTCVGCHQTRAIGGFHFTGRDPFGKYAGNSVFLPGSAHFMGDLPRRLDLVQSVAQNSVQIDYSRGFAARPKTKYKDLLDGSGLYNGWGSHCTTADDPSFASWKCAPGLECRQLHDVSDQTGMGLCIGGSQQQVGDPCEFGTVTNKGFDKDKFNRFPGKYYVTLPNSRCSPQSQLPGTKTGGFLHGSVRKLTCENGPGEPGLPKEAECGPIAKVGFNSCIGRSSFSECIQKYTEVSGLRGCDSKNPCRDDYICSESFNEKRGVCIPPYFLFQFRVDGHPSSGF